MRKTLLKMSTIFLLFICVTGCYATTTSSDEKGNSKKEFSITETATVNKTKIKVNSVKKILNECSWEYDGQCQSYTEPENNFFLLLDLTIENNGDEELNVSSIASFELKNSSGEKGKYSFSTKSVTSQLDGSVMSGDSLKGQILYDVKESNEYYFYYKDSLIDDSIKFVIKNSDITE